MKETGYWSTTAGLTTNTVYVARKFARRWFGPYVVTSANDSATYHLAELDGSRLVVPIVGKRVRIFKKRQDKDSDLDHVDDEHNRAYVNEDMEESD